jgi:hypothetical protein
MIGRGGWVPSWGRFPREVDGPRALLAHAFRFGPGGRTVGGMLAMGETPPLGSRPTPTLASRGHWT